MFFILDYPDYSQQDYSQYAGQVKYEEGDEEKYRPAELDTGNGNRDTNYEEGDYWSKTSIVITQML